jgi:hypothetical protein
MPPPTVWMQSVFAKAFVNFIIRHRNLPDLTIYFSLHDCPFGLLAAIRCAVHESQQWAVCVVCRPREVDRRRRNAEVGFGPKSTPTPISLLSCKGRERLTINR